MQVKKRDGRIVDFDRNKIFQAMKKAFLEVQDKVHPETLAELTSIVEEQFYSTQKEEQLSREIIDIETIQNRIEKVLMLQYPDAAKAYILHRQKRTELRPISPDPNAIADYIHAAKYARFLPNLQRRETFSETVNRVKHMHQEKYPDLKEEISKAFQLVHEKRVLPSMRSMQFAGKPLHSHNARMYNCCFSLVDRPRIFGDILYLLLCGCGVGFSVQSHHVKKLPVLKKIDHDLVCHYSITDSIQGWADAVKTLMDSFLQGYNLEFSYTQIRPTGSALHSGGKAPGHYPLKIALEEMRTILLRAQERRLEPIECHDIICHLSKSVLAGGIRRSSLISLFSIFDNKMLECKDISHFNFTELNTHRALANNSVVLNSKDTTKEVFKSILDLNKTNLGDPGFIFLDELDYGVNPCGEIGINPIWKSRDWNERETGFGFCNLVEINAAACKNEQEFFEAARAASFIATLQAGYTDFPYLGKVTEAIIRRDALIGVSITGMMDSPWIFDDEILQGGAHIVVDVNKHIANKIGINSAARCTCIKPSGTASLELGCIGSGIHAHHAKKYLRRIAANPLEPVVKFFSKHNPHMVETKPNGDLCLTFPVQTDGTTTTDMTTKEFLDKIFLVYKNWVEPGHVKKDEIGHNVSCTVMVRPDEWEFVTNYIWENRDKVRCMTFLPVIAPSKIPYIPRQAVITEDEIIRFNSLIQNYTPVDYSKMEENEDVTIRGAACSSDVCDPGDVDMVGGTGCRVFIGTAVTNEFKMDDLEWIVVKRYDTYYIAKRKDSR